MPTGLMESPDDMVAAMIEPAVILIILVCNAAVGVVQETNAEKAIERLKEMEASEAKVLRNVSRIWWCARRHLTVCRGVCNL